MRAGMTSLAKRSVLVRTVEIHLARIYAKVGATNRVDLAGALA